jgi:hypothetical protein
MLQFKKLPFLRFHFAEAKMRKIRHFRNCKMYLTITQFKEKQANGRNNYCHNIRAFRAGWHMVKPPFEGKEE